MAFFFAGRCCADFQRHALSEMLEKPELRASMPTELLADHLYRWMLGDTPVIEHVLENVLQLPPTPETTSESISVQVSVPSSDQTGFYYGNEGKRNATRYMMSILKQMDKPCSILFASDDNLEWLFEDYLFTREFAADLTSIFQRGFTLYHIMPSLNFMNRYVESLRYWLPIYASGHAKVFYYPRLRDNLYRHSLILLPEYGVLATTSIGTETDLITLVSTDISLINAYHKQYEHHLSLCRPALISHTSPTEFISCFGKLLKSDGDIIQ